MNWNNIIKNNDFKRYSEKKRLSRAKKVKGYEFYKENVNSNNAFKFSKCGWCGQWYIKTANKQKYCCDDCRDDARSLQSRVKSHRWYHKHKHELSEKQRWGLGSGVIGQHRHDDFEREMEVVSKELKRLGVRKSF